MTEKYFANDPSSGAQKGYEMGLQAELAWDLIRSHPNINGIQDREDSAGRAKIRLQTPQEVVERSFAMSGLFVARCIEEKQIRPGMAYDEWLKFRKVVALAGSVWPKDDDKTKTDALEEIRKTLQARRSI